MWKLIGDQTSFSIPESLATILNSAKIVAYNAGEIVNNPLHDELMARKGFYYALYMSQVKGKALAGAEIVVYYVAIGHKRMSNQGDNKEPAMEKGILLSEQERVAFKMISTGNDLHGKRATALLAIDEGASQAQAAQLSGLTPGQVKYWLGKFRDVRMEIFPETVLETEQTDPAQDQPAEGPAAVEPLDKSKKPEPAKNKQKTKQKSKPKKGGKSKAKKGKGKKKKKKKGSGKKGTKK